MSLLSPSLIAFRAVVEKGTVLEAATLVQLTQTGVTQRIRSLEKQLGVTLFTRSRKGMRLTQEGENLLRYVQAVEVLEGDTLLNLSDSKASPNQEIKISGSAMSLKTYLFSPLGKWTKNKSSVNFKIQEVSHQRALEDLKQGHADFALLPETMVGAELTSVKLKAQNLVFICNTDVKSATIDKLLSMLEFIDISEESLPLQNELKKQKRKILSQQRLHLVNNFSVMIDLLQNTPAISIAPQQLALSLQKKGLAKILKHNLVSKSQMHLCWYKRQTMPVAMKEFISLLKDSK